MQLDFPSASVKCILCVGAHSDDIEIGAGATLLSLAPRFPEAAVHWVVLAGGNRRSAEARASAAFFSSGFGKAEIVVHDFRDGFFPTQLANLKECLEGLKPVAPDLVFTHYREDRHQDHRTVSDLTWQTFRDHLILEYEIPKFDGDLGAPNLFHPVSVADRDRKLEALDRFFGSQRDKRWFTDDTFSGLMRLRGIECNAESGFAEAFYCRKMVI